MTLDEGNVLADDTPPPGMLYYAVEDRPVMLENGSPPRPDARALDLPSGAFVPDGSMLTRILSGGQDVEQLSEVTFQRLVHELRRSASYDRQVTPMVWHSTGDPEYPYKSELNRTTYTLYYGDFPAQPMYTILVGDQTVDNLDTWPQAWKRD
jgi:hypothetical protein